MGNFARSLGLARVTHVVGGYGFGSPHSLAGAIPVDPLSEWEYVETYPRAQIESY